MTSIIQHELDQIAALAQLFPITEKIILYKEITHWAKRKIEGLEIQRDPARFLQRLSKEQLYMLSEILQKTLSKSK